MNTSCFTSIRFVLLICMSFSLSYLLRVCYFMWLEILTAHICCARMPISFRVRFTFQAETVIVPVSNESVSRRHRTFLRVVQNVTLTWKVASLKNLQPRSGQKRKRRNRIIGKRRNDYRAKILLAAKKNICKISLRSKPPMNPGKNRDPSLNGEKGLKEKMSHEPGKCGRRWQSERGNVNTRRIRPIT